MSTHTPPLTMEMLNFTRKKALLASKVGKLCYKHTHGQLFDIWRKTSLTWVRLRCIMLISLLLCFMFSSPSFVDTPFWKMDNGEMGAHTCGDSFYIKEQQQHETTKDGDKASAARHVIESTGFCGMIYCCREPIWWEGGWFTKRL